MRSTVFILYHNLQIITFCITHLKMKLSLNHLSIISIERYPTVKLLISEVLKKPSKMNLHCLQDMNQLGNSVTFFNNYLLCPVSQHCLKKYNHNLLIIILLCKTDHFLTTNKIPLCHKEKETLQPMA